MTGTVSAGFAPGLAKAVLPQTLARYTREFPKVDIEISSGTSDALVAETSRGALDFYVGQFDRPQVGITATAIGRFPVASPGRDADSCRCSPFACMRWCP
ncbi:LysR substrate-binding domain-containing protein [Hoeflea sp.]|uniref:LysR substrate-binding domain-containing protein n=1 Tax=Hoeflea sp. TaxID=1940281 RepID=UPI0019AAE61F|nr:LysR substrate-binding domain-containing protein [Hoeflea sp.]MBC7281425.1 hypothetical protein [Hoeflea sp.]